MLCHVVSGRFVGCPPNLVNGRKWFGKLLNDQQCFSRLLNGQKWLGRQWPGMVWEAPERLPERLPEPGTAAEWTAGGFLDIR